MVWEKGNLSFLHEYSYEKINFPLVNHALGPGNQCVGAVILLLSPNCHRSSKVLLVFQGLPQKFLRLQFQLLSLYNSVVASRAEGYRSWFGRNVISNKVLLHPHTSPAKVLGSVGTQVKVS